MGIKMVKLTLVLLALSLVSFVACSGAQPAAQTPSPSAATPGAPQAKSPSTGPSAARQPSSTPQSAAPASQTITVSGSGNIAVSSYANLYFGTGGKIEKINVQKGDLVSKGKVLAKLDITSLELAISQAKVTLDQAKLAQAQAVTSLESAKFTLDKTKAVSDIMNAITEAEWELKIIEMRFQEASKTDTSGNTSTYLNDASRSAKAKKDALNKTLSDLLGKAEYSGIYDPRGQKYDRLIVADVRMKELLVESAQLTIDKSQDTIDQAQKSMEMAQKQLNDATISAPFDGIVGTLDVKEGDVVSGPTAQKPIIYLIDPTTMQVAIGVNELDVPKVSAGQIAVVKVDAFPGTKLEGRVTAISPLPNIQGGVVYYDVTVVFNVPPLIGIKIGMNATAEITLK